MPPEIREGLKARARKMRSASTEAEDLLWHAVRDRRLGNLKVRRQYLLGAYIVDFFIVKAKLVIEIDGPIHAGQAGYDQQRARDLAAQGYRILRFSNEDVLRNLDQALKTIQSAATNSE